MRAAIFLLAALLSLPAQAFELPVGCRQLLVATAPTWDASHATLRLYEKSGRMWQAVGAPWEARLGKSGLVWGLGLHPVPAGARTKREGDKRTPAGVFRLGGAWGYAADAARNPRLPYTQITPRDLWVEDPDSPNYNRHVRLDAEPSTAWEKKQQMKQDDPAHALKLFIEHNAGDTVRPGAGSSIFFHIWRGGGSQATAGCTAMSEPSLRALIAALDPSKNPLFVVLPDDEYARLRAAWKLP